MQTTPFLGMTIPSGDGDPFDEMAYSNALVVVDTFASTAARKGVATAQVFAGDVQAPNINATVGFQVGGAPIAAANIANAADKSSAATQTFTGAVQAAGLQVTSVNGGGLGYATGHGIGGSVNCAANGSCVLNGYSGSIVSTSSIAINGFASYTVTSSVLAATDMVLVLLQNGTPSQVYRVTVINQGNAAANTFTFIFENASNAAITPHFNFAILKAAQT